LLGVTSKTMRPPRATSCRSRSAHGELTMRASRPRRRCGLDARFYLVSGNSRTFKHNRFAIDGLSSTIEATHSSGKSKAREPENLTHPLVAPRKRRGPTIGRNRLNAPGTAFPIVRRGDDDPCSEDRDGLRTPPRCRFPNEFEHGFVGSERSVGKVAIRVHCDTIVKS
jgi:hypothetical protein